MAATVLTCQCPQTRTRPGTLVVAAQGVAGRGGFDEGCALVGGGGAAADEAGLFQALDGAGHGGGGTVEGRSRFAVEVVTAVAEVIGSHRVGLRISPGNPFNDIAEDDPAEVYEAPLERLAGLDLAYLHLMEGPDRALTARLRRAWPGTIRCRVCPQFMSEPHIHRQSRRFTLPRRNGS